MSFLPILPSGRTQTWGNRLCEETKQRPFINLACRFSGLITHLRSLSWIGDIPKLVADHGLTVVDSATRPFDSTLVPLTIRTYLAGWAELFQLVGKTKDPSLPTASECQRVLLELDAGVKHGALYYWLPVNLLAQKPSIE